MNVPGNETPAINEQQVKAMLDIFDPLFSRKSKEGIEALLHTVLQGTKAVKLLCASLHVLKEIGLTIEELQTIADIAVITTGKAASKEEIEKLVEKVQKEKKS